MSVHSVVVCFAHGPALHWTPRLRAGSKDVAWLMPPTTLPVVTNGKVENLPEPQTGVRYLVNAAVFAALEASASERTDICALPMGIPQDDSPVELSTLRVLNYPD